MLHIQQWLRNGRSVEELGIRLKTHPTYSSLQHCSYNQFESPKDHPVVKEARGLILDAQNDWRVVAFPFTRFANHGESWAAPLDWTTVRVQEKIDGSLIVMWHYGGRWNVSTKGSPDAGGSVAEFDFTFADLFWRTLRRYTAGPTWFNPAYTYMLELTSPYNRVVCSYGSNPALTLIGVRDIAAKGFPELRVDQFADGPIPIVKEYPLTSVNQIMNAAVALDPMHNEGFVAVDMNFNRVKIKSPSYVMCHHMKDGFGQRRIIRLIQLGETSEVLSYFPEYQELFDSIRAKIDSTIAEIEADYQRLRYLTDRKVFALEAQKCKDSGVLFALYLGKTTNVRDYILHSKQIVRKATATEAAVEDFHFSEEKIERMIGLKARPFSTPDEC